MSPQSLLALALALCVLFLGHRTFMRLARPGDSEARLGQWLLLLFAWSFVLGAVMRWARLGSG